MGLSLSAEKILINLIPNLEPETRQQAEQGFSQEICPNLEVVTRHIKSKDMFPET